MASDGLGGPFRRPVLVWLVTVAASSLGLGLALLVAGPTASEVVSSGADAFSRSAIGHRAFLDLLRARGVPVFVSRYDSGGRAGASALLLVAEPHLESVRSTRERRMEMMLGSARTVLLVLPKWTGTDDPLARGWIAAADPVPESMVARALLAAGITATVARPGREGSERCEGAGTPVTWSSPQLISPLTPSLRPLIRCAGGVLLGEVEAANRIFVLSDPDMVSNHGLAQGENARFAIEILDRVRRPGQSIVVDEMLHGHELIPSLWREAFAFPLLPSVLQAALALAALVWSGMARFGAPIAAAPTLAPGKSVLIENTASLMRSAGHSAFALGRYFDATLLDVARSLHAPAFAKDGERRRWLEGVGRRRGGTIDLKTLEAQVERVRWPDVPGAMPIVAAARRIHRWKGEMLRGPHDHPGR